MAKADGRAPDDPCARHGDRQAGGRADDRALSASSGNAHRKVKTVVTNADGRCDAPLLEGEAFQTGEYELVFFAGDYLRGAGRDAAGSRRSST